MPSKANYVAMPGEWPGRITADRRGRLRIYLGKRRCTHADCCAECIRCGGKGYVVPDPANSGGWQWLSRFIVWQRTGVVLPTAMHTHHSTGQMDSLEVQVVPSSIHGRIHAYATNPFRRRGPDGRWRSQLKDEPIPKYSEIAQEATAE